MSEQEKDSQTCGVLDGISVLVPACNEEATIATCLEALAQSAWPGPGRLEVIVIANGCVDRTAEVARQFNEAFAARGFDLRVLDRKEGGKLGALNAGDAIARFGSRVYLDADVTVSPELMWQLKEALDVPGPRYASGTIHIAPSGNLMTRAYARVYSKIPFMTYGVPGCGLFATNAPGRLRWGRFPDIISDDTFVRLSFRPEERVSVPARFDWPLVDGWRNLVRVRRRQNRGVDEVAQNYPELLENDDKPPLGVLGKLRLALGDPIGFAVYVSVALAVKLMPATSDTWSRGR